MVFLTDRDSEVHVGNVCAGPCVDVSVNTITREHFEIASSILTDNLTFMVSFRNEGYYMFIGLTRSEKTSVMTTPKRPGGSYVADQVADLSPHRSAISQMPTLRAHI